MHNAAEAGNLEAFTTLLVRSITPYLRFVLIQSTLLSQNNVQATLVVQASEGEQPSLRIRDLDQCTPLHLSLLHGVDLLKDENGYHCGKTRLSCF